MATSGEPHTAWHPALLLSTALQECTANALYSYHMDLSAANSLSQALDKLMQCTAIAVYSHIANTCAVQQPLEAQQAVLLCQQPVRGFKKAEARFRPAVAVHLSLPSVGHSTVYRAEPESGRCQSVAATAAAAALHLRGNLATVQQYPLVVFVLLGHQAAVGSYKAAVAVRVQRLVHSQ